MIPSSIADVCVLLGILGINKKGMLSPRENQRKERKLMSTTTLQVSTKARVIKVINILITLFFMFGFGMLPPFSTLTPVGMKVLGIFIGAVYGFSTCEIVWPALFAIVAYGTSGYPASMSAAVSSMIGNNSVFTSIVILITAGALTYYGFGKWFVRWSLSTRLFKGKPMLYVWSFFVVFGLSCALISQIAMGLLMFVIWQDIADTCNYDEKDPFRYAGYVGIIISTILGGGMLTYRGWAYGVMNNWAEATGSHMSIGLQAAMTIPATVIILTVYVFAAKWFFKIDYSRMKAFDVEKLGEESKVLRPRAKRIAIMYVLFVGLTIIANTFYKTGFATFINNKITAAGMYALCGAILMILPSGEGDGKACIEFDKIKNTAMSWNVLFMCAVVIPVASALTNEKTGIGPWLQGIFDPIFGSVGQAGMLIITVILVLVLTNLGSNSGIAAAMVPILAPYVVKGDMNAQVVGTCFLYIVNMGMLLPSASAPAAVFHAMPGLSDGKLRMKHCVFAFFCVMIAAIPVFAIYGLIF